MTYTATRHDALSPSDLVGAREIAERLGVSTAAVTNWRARGHVKPIAELACGPIYAWPAVERFALVSDRIVGGKVAALALESIRASVKRDLREQADAVTYLFAEKMARPPAKLRGDGKGNGRGEWDWLYELSTSEREHIARKWLTGTLAPDQWANAMQARTGTDDVNEAMAVWLAAVRLHDAVDAVLTNHAPRHAVTSSEGYDVARLFGPDAVSYLVAHFAALETEYLDRETDRHAMTVFQVTDNEEVF